MGESTPRKYDLDRIVRLLLTAATVIGLVLLVRYLATVLIPFAAAVLLAYLLNPIVTFIDRKIRRRPLSVLLTVGGFGLVSIACLAILIPVLRTQVGEVVEIVTAAGAQSGEADSSVGRDSIEPVRSEGAPPLTTTQADTPDEPTGRTHRLRDALASNYLKFHDQQLPWVREVLDALAAVPREDLQVVVVGAAKRVGSGMWGLVTGAVSLAIGLAGLVVVILYVVFLLMGYPAYSRQWPGLIPPAYRQQIVEFVEEFKDVMSRYFRGQVFIAMINAVLFSIGFTIIGLRMSVMLGLFVGALNIVPYLQSVGLVPALLLAGVRAIEREGSLAWSILLVLLVFGIVQIISDWILTPAIMGRRTGLNPIAILLSIFIWGKLLGLLGLLLALPLTCMGKAYYERMVL